MSTYLLMLSLIVLCGCGNAGRIRSLGLYDPTDNVTILTSDNFYDHFLNRENAWVIELYNSWCGHCIKFAPTWKTFGSYTNGWNRVLSVGVLDCSNSKNTDQCRKFYATGYPTIMYFKPHQDKLHLNETYHKADTELSGGQPLSTLLKTTHEFLTSISNPPASWPKLHPLQTMQEIWTDATENHDHVFLIFEEQQSVLGSEVILDTMNLQNILVRRMLKGDVSKFGINRFPSLYSIAKDGIYNKVLFGKNNPEDRRNFVKLIFKWSGVQVLNQETEKNREDLKFISGAASRRGDKTVQENQTAIVYMKDLETALHYSLKQEVAIQNTISQEELDTLKDFINILSRYIPVRRELKIYLQKIQNWLNGIFAPLTGETWASQLNKLQDEKSSSDDLEWIGCKGSEMRYRGYPCGMWILFHTLTVSSYLTELNTDPKEVLLVIRGYMKYFFGCEECSQNFLKMASNIESEVKKSEDTVLWLWRAHNKANKRLHGDLSEDPKHPKIQFPSKASCSQCHKVGGSAENPVWDEVSVLKYLVQLYGADHLHIEQSESHTRMARKEGQLDWWENKQRKQDLVKIHELRRQKKLLDQKMSRERTSKQDHQQDDDYLLSKMKRAPGRGWGLNGVDLGMCMMFYVMCAIIILLMYYHFTIRRNWKPCACLPI